MPRVSVWLPDQLAGTVTDTMPGVNFSKVLQDGLQSLLDCKHEALVCAACSEQVDRAGIIDRAKSEFYSQLLWELQDLVAVGGTAEGAARVAKSVAVAQHVSGARNQPLPRPSRSRHRRRENDAEWFAAANRELAAERARAG